MKIHTAIHILIAIICYFPTLIYAEPNNFENDKAQALFNKAQSFESAEDYQVAIQAYEEIMEKHVNSIYAGESLFKKAAILDEKLFFPAKALDYYQKYIDRYNGRHSRRAEIRINLLKRYQNVDPVVYKEFNTILNSYRPGENAVFIKRVEKFITDYPAYKTLDDALFWLANEYRGRKRAPETALEFKNIEKAIPLYNRILEEYPDSPHKLSILKNIGDCYFFLKKYGKAQEYFNRVADIDKNLASGLIGNDLMRANIKSYRYNLFLLTMAILTASIVMIIKVVPVKSIKIFSGLKIGIFHTLFFIPVAIILPVVTFLLTDARHDNMTGMEPWLMILIMVVTAFFILINGIVMELDSRIEVKMRYYLPLLLSLHLSITYILFYSLGLMTYIERLFL
ncbi:MAG: tetratricopeptide repeat-containing protein [Gammaproteobacteria bacterium]|nr:MAG: tetratricopeptide repeat-containing protein [Gammaproteobacteria bacterium]